MDSRAAIALLSALSLQFMGGCPPVTPPRTDMIEGHLIKVEQVADDHFTLLVSTNDNTIARFTPHTPVLIVVCSAERGDLPRVRAVGQYQVAEMTTVEVADDGQSRLTLAGTLRFDQEPNPKDDVRVVQAQHWDRSTTLANRTYSPTKYRPGDRHGGILFLACDGSLHFGNNTVVHADAAGFGHGPEGRHEQAHPSDGQSYRPGPAPGSSAGQAGSYERTDTDDQGTSGGGGGHLTSGSAGSRGKTHVQAAGGDAIAVLSASGDKQPLDDDHAFLGPGGGAGAADVRLEDAVERDWNHAGFGGRGGGLVVILARSLVGRPGMLSARGGAGGDSGPELGYVYAPRPPLPPDVPYGRSGPGGGGAGGTILLLLKNGARSIRNQGLREELLAPHSSAVIGGNGGRWTEFRNNGPSDPAARVIVENGELHNGDTSQGQGGYGRVVVRGWPPAR